MTLYGKWWEECLHPEDPTISVPRMMLDMEHVPEHIGCYPIDEVDDWSINQKIIDSLGVKKFRIE